MASAWMIPILPTLQAMLRPRAPRASNRNTRFKPKSRSHGRSSWSAKTKQARKQMLAGLFFKR
jgi:hypothetical protein